MADLRYTKQHKGNLHWLTNQDFPLLNKEEVERLIQKRKQECEGEEVFPKIRTSRGAFWVIPIVDGKSKVIVRQYKRGGLIAKIFTKNFYCCPFLNWPTWRSYSEFKNALYLWENDFPIPRPLFAATRKVSSWRYQAFIGYEFLEGAQNLLVASEHLSFTRLSELFHQVGVQAFDMLRLGVMHNDLHVGNVLLLGENVFIIDFDKSYRIDPQTDTSTCRMRLIERWRRSLRRHKMPEDLIEPYIEGLNYEMSGAI
ncbi:MAG: phosphotransferase [Deltaproteobacteria bacterium]|nr:phosphotransferase [Deltaproteobacteria bacterium]